MSLVGKNRNKYTNIRLLLAIMFAGGSLLVYVIFSIYRQKQTEPTRHYFYPVGISEFSSGIPCIHIEVEGKSALVKVDLGTSDISLPTEFLQEMNKEFIHRELSFGIRGKKYESNVYTLPKITIGEITISAVVASEQNPDFEKDTILAKDDGQPSNSHLGRIGWDAFCKVNVLLDCEHSILAFCDGLDTLKKQGYPIEDFIETSFHLDRGLIEFDAMTEKGPLHCILDTGSTWSMLNKDLEGNSNDHMIHNPMHIDPEQYQLSNPDNTDLMVFDPVNIYKTSMFRIGKKDFVPMTFNQIKMTAQIDAIIGMDFLDATLIFIDFANRKIYFYEYPEEVENVSALAS